jgi:hypothetical protein
MHLDQRDNDQEPTSKAEKVFLVVMSLAFFSMMVMEVITDYEPKKLGAVLFVVFWIPLLFIHEFGHAMMARLLGWRVNRIVIGVGKIFTQTRFLNAPMEIRMIPLEGFVQIAPKTLQFARLKHALIYFAGPGIELLLFFLIVAYLGSFEQFFTISNDYVKIALQSFAFAGLVGAVLNLIPMGILTRDGSTPNDGMGILLCLFATELDYESWIKESQKDDESRLEL